MRHEPLVRRAPAAPGPTAQPALTWWLIRDHGTAGHVLRSAVGKSRVPRTLCGQMLRRDARRAPYDFAHCRVCARIVTGSW